MWRVVKEVKQCDWCYEADQDHGIYGYKGKRCSGHCEDCGTTEDVHEVIYIAKENR